MKLYHMLIAAATVAVAGCASEDGSPEMSSSAPTPAQVEQALSDPMYIAAVESLAIDGLQADIEASDVITIEGGDWSLSAPVVAVSSGVTVPYEAVIYEVRNGGADVWLEPVADAELASGESEGSLLGSSSHALGTCTAWSGWYTVSSYCDWKVVCFGEATMWHRQRQRTCYYNNNGWTEYDNTTVRHACGC